MAQEYLPAPSNIRLADLMKEHNTFGSKSAYPGTETYFYINTGGTFMTEPHTLYVFGTGNATMTRYYNTCFAIRSGEEYFMTDAGGGNGILRILEEMQVPLNRIHHLFVTHEHTDHILGVIWMIRMIGTAIKKGNYEGIFHIYCHDGLIDTIQTFCRLTLQKKFCDLIGDPIQLIPVSDRETRQILDMEVTFFDIHSTKARQFGFRAVLPDGKIVCCPGDEPLNPLCEEFAKGAWRLVK